MLNGPMIHPDAPADSLYAMARTNDPETSKLAAQKMNDTGATESHAYVVRLELAQNPNSTYRELARVIDKYEPSEVMKRLHDLNKRGDVFKSGKRVCRVKGNPSATWRAL